MYPDCVILSNSCPGLHALSANPLAYYIIPCHRSHDTIPLTHVDTSHLHHCSIHVHVHVLHTWSWRDLEYWMYILCCSHVHNIRHFLYGQKHLTPVRIIQPGALCIPSVTLDELWSPVYPSWSYSLHLSWVNLSLAALATVMVALYNQQASLLLYQFCPLESVTSSDTCISLRLTFRELKQHSCQCAHAQTNDTLTWHNACIHLQICTHVSPLILYATNVPARLVVESI